MVSKELESRVLILKKGIISVQSNITNGNHSDEVYSTGRDCLKTLQQISNETSNMIIALLQSTEIGKVLNKFKKVLSKHKEDEDEGIRADKKELCDLASQLLDKWKNRVRMNNLREELDTIHNKWKESESNDRSTEDIESANDALKKLGEMEMTLKILSEKPRIGGIVVKFKHYKETKLQALRVIGKWTNLSTKAFGPANEALTAFRQREKQLKAEGQFKPDMVAFKELRNTYLPKIKKHGNIEGVPVGIRLAGRGEAAILDIHRKILNGIDSVKDEACFAVCISGKYDDEDIFDDDSDDNDNNGTGNENGTNDGTILYTGSGGQKNGKQVEDQVLNVDNESLMKSIRTELPIRLLRRRNRRIGGGKKGSYISEYVYDGLYKCTAWEYENSSDGPKVYKFTLKPITGSSHRSSTTSNLATSSSSSPSPSRTRRHAASKSRGRVRDRLASRMQKT